LALAILVSALVRLGRVRGAGDISSVEQRPYAYDSAFVCVIRQQPDARYRGGGFDRQLGF
jgi:hypothetical protein